METPAHPITLEPGSHHQVTIDSVAYGGSGIAKINHLIVFVPFTAPGDTAEIEITEVKPNFAKARVVQMTTFSPQRCQPVCPFFGSCGGCQYQHIAYEHQVKIKEAQIKDIFQRIGNFHDPQVNTVVPSDQAYGYRIKAEFHIKTGLMGYFANDNRTILDIPACPLVDDKINRQYAQTREAFRQEQPAYVPDPLVLWASVYEQKYFNVFDRRAQPRFISRKIQDKIFNVPYQGFFQVNYPVSEKLVAAVVEIGRAHV
jgi:tRNA/tmRNA/rRNA uracil-C5-methylase (TrmA/RlmC/RlmD family)